MKIAIKANDAESAYEPYQSKEPEALKKMLSKT